MNEREEKENNALAFKRILSNISGTNQHIQNKTNIN